MEIAEKQNRILVPKELIKPVKVVSLLTEGAKRTDRFYLRIFNTRSNKDHFLLHFGSKNFLFRDPKYIQVLNRTEVISLLYRLNDKIKNSRFLDFQITKESRHENNKS